MLDQDFFIWAIAALIGSGLIVTALVLVRKNMGMVAMVVCILGCFFLSTLWAPIISNMKSGTFIRIDKLTTKELLVVGRAVSEKCRWVTVDGEKDDRIVYIGDEPLKEGQKFFVKEINGEKKVFVWQDPPAK